MDNTALDTMRAAGSTKAADEAEAAERYKLVSRERLLGILTKKLKTSFIGALDAFEVAFGHQWGHGKKPHQCTLQELDIRKVWDAVRTTVLNNGNNQLRAVQAELALHDVVWLAYRNTLLVKQGTDNG